MIEEILDWAKHPFDSGGTAFNWVLFVGLLVIAAWMWNHIVNSIVE